MIRTRRASNIITAKQSWTNPKQNIRHIEETLIISSSNKNQQSDFDSYLSKRRNTTGSISLNKIIDSKNTSNNSNSKISTESKILFKKT